MANASAHRPPVGSDVVPRVMPELLRASATGGDAGGSVERVVRPSSSLLGEIFPCHPDVSGDLPKQNGGQIPASMIRYRGLPPIRVPELTVRSSLANLDETESLQDRDYLPRLEHRQAGHGLPKRLASECQRILTR